MANVQCNTKPQTGVVRTRHIWMEMPVNKNGLGWKWTISEVLLHTPWARYVLHPQVALNNLIFNKSAPLWDPNKKIEKNF